LKHLESPREDHDGDEWHPLIAAGED